MYMGLEIARTQNKFGIKELIAAAAAIFVSYGVIASTAPQVRAETSTVVVTPTDLQGWVATETGSGNVEFSNEFGAPSGLNAGSLKITTTDGTGKGQMTKAAPANTQLDDMDDVLYNSYRSSSSTGSAVQVAAVNVAVDINGAAAGGF